MPLSFFCPEPLGKFLGYCRDRLRIVKSRKIIRLQVAESTNSVALDAGQHGAAVGTVIVAQSQTSGRGRLNRFWLSPPGMGLYFSIILRPHLAVEDLPKITLTAGLAVCKGVEIAYDVCPKIKWPNDLLLGGRKFGGILTETGPIQNMAVEGQVLVVVDLKIDANALLETCAAAIEAEVHRLESQGFPTILADWQKRDAVKDRVLNWVTPEGRKVTGVSLEPDEHGMLRIRDDNGTIYTVISGDVKLVGKFPG
jgi:BirA family biotin operon repressor/biotin-[acetyl-CoA-carboxylase] ligase